MRDYLNRFFAVIFLMMCLSVLFIGGKLGA
ncbi:hypothetical protein ABID52_001547 [Fictibacillus halophilus]|uniref:Uncharacterized protein n=1 Tax=Fictibacillus halophilus TaxID=1610490 RepID=A0ABV2LI01_9BACL